MSRYVLKRIGYGLLTLFLVSTITFFLMYLIPGGPFLAEKAKTEETMRALEEKYGLDKPVPVQYVNYMKKIVTGDLGLSTKQRGRTVNDIIGESFPTSAKIGSIAVAVAITVGIPLGCIAALNRGRFVDNDSDGICDNNDGLGCSQNGTGSQRGHRGGHRK